MNDGFITLWIAVVLGILLLTGWKSYIVPGISSSKAMVIGAIVVATMPFPIQYYWGASRIYVHIAVLLLFLLSLWTLVQHAESPENACYLASAFVIAAAVWCLLKKMYGADPVFYWLDPRWDGAIIIAILSVCFTKNAASQYAFLLASAALGEWLYAALTSASPVFKAGGLAWWDSLAVAILLGAILRNVKELLIRLRHKRWGDI